MTTITENERKLLVAIRDNEFHDGRHPVNDEVWVNCIVDPDTNDFYTKRTYSGLMSSLSKKHLVRTDGECCSITQDGFDAVA